MTTMLRALTLLSLRLRWSVLSCLALTILLASLPPTTASALSCVSNETIGLEKRFSDSTVVFRGDVTDKTENDTYNVADVKVAVVYKGGLAAGSTISVIDREFGGGTITFSKVGDELLIFANQENGTYFTENCSGSVAMSSDTHNDYGYEGYSSFEENLNRLSTNYISFENSENNKARYTNSDSSISPTLRLALGLLLVLVMLLALYSTTNIRKKIN